MAVGLGVVVVRGRSMEPTLHTGDRMVVLRGAPPRMGRLAIVRLPPDESGMPRPLAIKRVTGRDPSDPRRYWVESDNQTVSGVADSWTHGIGSLAREQIRAVVLFRIPQRLRLPGGRRPLQ
ncbi:S24/S26 family peptidase [Pedococcus sp. 5OH_020]|uniref:S24/S26 family peptidase n=1 Tax=Pedococcus sp. 5OH_020 TaxID=2989814 RepID=UPI0022EA072D|nr:S24/S26 family peptidase [Pedococcus sp. 5OH_020]